MGKKFWIIPAFILGYVFYQKYLLSKTFSVIFKGLEFGDLSFFNPTINLIVQVNNPTQITSEIMSIKGDLFVDGAMVGSVLGITPTTLKVGSSNIKIPVTLSYTGVADLLQKFKNTDFNYKFVGSIVVDFIEIPLKFGYPTNG